MAPGQGYLWSGNSSLSWVCIVASRWQWSITGWRVSAEDMYVIIFLKNATKQRWDWDVDLKLHDVNSWGISRLRDKGVIMATGWSHYKETDPRVFVLSDRTGRFDWEKQHRCSQQIDGALVYRLTIGCQLNKRWMTLEIKLIWVTLFTKTSLRSPGEYGKKWNLCPSLSRFNLMFRVCFKFSLNNPLFSRTSKFEQWVREHQRQFSQKLQLQSEPQPGYQLRGPGSQNQAGHQCDRPCPKGLIPETELCNEMILPHLELNPWLTPPEASYRKSGKEISF